jgi:parvulin-like peptidyl-prolyl isomerase
MLLDQIRQSTRNGLMYVVIALIIVVFVVQFGAQGDGCQSSQGAAKDAAYVGSYTIKSDEIGLIYNRYAGNRRDPDEASINAEQAKSLRAVILIHLLADEARKVGLRVTDDEFKAYMVDPARNLEFQALYGNTGILDGPYYKNYITNQLRVSIKRYEEFKRVELLARKYMELAELPITALDSEVTAIQNLRDTKVNLEFVRVAPAQVEAGITVTDAEIDQLLASDKAAVEKLYKEREAEYKKAAQIQLRRIYIVRPEGADKAKADAAQAKFDAAKKRVIEGKEDFAAVAGELSEDYAKEKGGLMDWSTIDNVDQSIAAAVKDAKKGDVKEVSTDFAFMLVKVEDTKEPEVTPLATVERELARDVLKRAKSATEIDALAAKLLDQSKGAESLSAALEALAKADAPAAPAAPTTPPTTPPADGAPAPEAPKSVWTTLSAKDTGLFNLEGQDLSSMFGGQLPPGVTLGLGEWDRLPGIGQSSEIALDAFKLTKEAPLGQKVYTVGDARVIVRLKERRDPKDIEGEKPELRAVALREELGNKRLATTLGQWQGIFLVPQDKYGDMLESLYDDAVKTGRVRLNKNSAQAAPLIKKSEEAAAPAADAAAAPAAAGAAAPAAPAAPAEKK